MIESALGLDAYEGEGEGRDEEGSTGVGFFMSEGRKSLREACTVVVEDAINAVLLGMRERVGRIRSIIVAPYTLCEKINSPGTRC